MNSVREDIAIEYKPSDPMQLSVFYPTRVQHPSDYWVFTETIRNLNRAASRIFIADLSNPGERPIHLRHRNNANMVFLDGHVEEVGRGNRLRRVRSGPFSVAIDANLRAVSIP